MSKILKYVVCMMLICSLTACHTKAKPLEFSQLGEFQTLEITTLAGETIEVTDVEWIGKFADVLALSGGTRKQSLQDVPANVAYGTLVFQGSKSVMTLYYYDEYGHSYIESPYVGIYKTDMDLEQYIKADF